MSYTRKKAINFALDMKHLLKSTVLLTLELAGINAFHLKKYPVGSKKKKEEKKKF